MLWYLTTLFSRIVRPAYRKNRELFDKAVLVLSENAQGVHVVKGFALQDKETEKFKQGQRRRRRPAPLDLPEGGAVYPDRRDDDGYQPACPACLRRVSLRERPRLCLRVGPVCFSRVC